MVFIKSSKGIVSFNGPNALIFSSVFCLSTEGKEAQKLFKYVSREGCVLQAVRGMVSLKGPKAFNFSRVLFFSARRAR